MSPRRVGIGLAAAVVAVIGAYLGVCWFVLATLITPERKPHDRSPAELGFDDVRGLAFRSRTGGVPLRGWLVGPDSGSAVVLVHGLHSHAWDWMTHPRRGIQQPAARRQMPPILPKV